MHEERVYGEEVGRMLGGMARRVRRRWAPRLGPERVESLLDGLRRVEALYTGRHYAEALRAVVWVCDALFGPETHVSNDTQETGRLIQTDLCCQAVGRVRPSGP